MLRLSRYDIGRFAFFRYPLGDLEATYNDHLRLIGTRVVDFLLVLVERLSLVLRKRSYGQISVENLRFRSNRGPVDPKFQVEGGRLPPTILLLRKLGKMCFRVV